MEVNGCVSVPECVNVPLSVYMAMRGSECQCISWCELSVSENELCEWVCLHGMYVLACECVELVCVCMSVCVCLWTCGVVLCVPRY